MSKKIKKVVIRHLRIEDYEELKNAMISSYNDMENAYWKERHIKTLLKKFPEGQIVVLADNIIVGCALSIRVMQDKAESDHTYLDITGNYTFNTHDKNGDTLYGIDVFISPKFRGLRLGRRLYDSRKELCEKLNLKSIVFGGRIPNYIDYAEQIKYD